VDTVTTFEVRLIANIGTGVEVFGGEMAVSEEIFGLCPTLNGAKGTDKARINRLDRITRCMCFLDGMK